MKVIGIIFCLIAVASCSYFVVDKEKYFMKLCDKVVAQLTGFPGTALNLEDFQTTIKNESLNKAFDGVVKFYSGFVNSIGNVKLTGVGVGMVTEQWNETGVKITFIIPFKIII